MTKEEADKLWNGPKCERCDAMESRLRAALLANQSWAEGFAKLKEQTERLLAENTKLSKYVVGVWGKA